LSQGQIFVNASAGIESPKDLEGKTVGLQPFQTTLAVLAKRDLSSLYSVSLEKIHWVVVHDDAIEIDYPGDFDIRKAPSGSNLSEMLSHGDIDGLFFPAPLSRKAEIKASYVAFFHRRRPRNWVLYRNTAIGRSCMCWH